MSRGARLAVWVGLAAVVTMAALQYSLRDGKLSAPPDWDDVMYMKYAGERFNELRFDGVRECVAGWARNTPHSPYECLLTFAAFLMFGLREWGPYALSGLVVLALLMVVDWAVGRRVRGSVNVLVAAYLCTVPTLTLAVTELKPDVSWGVAVSAVAALCMLRPIVGAPLRRLLALGLLLGVTLLIKPTTTPGTLALLGLCVVLGLAKDWLLNGRPRVRELLRVCGVAVAVAIVLAGPYFWVHWSYYDFYIRKTLFGEYRDAWRIPGGWAEQFAYFVTGPGGRANFAGHVSLIPIVWLIGWGVAIARRDRATMVRAGGLALVAAACFAMASVNLAKNTLLASPFFATVIVGTAFWIAYVARVERARFGRNVGTYATVGVMCVVGLFLYRWPSVYYAPDSVERAQSVRLHSEVYQALLNEEQPYPQLVTVTATGPVREVTLAWYAARDRRGFEFDRPGSDRLAEYDKFFDRSDFVLAQEDRVLGSAANMPNERIQGDVLAKIRSNPDYRQMAEFTASDGKKLVLFRCIGWSRGVTAGVRTLDGFGPIQGPNPATGLPMFRWGMAGGSELLLTPPATGRGMLRLTCRAVAGVKEVRAVVQGAVVAKHTFAQKPWTEEFVTLPLGPVANGDRVRLEYGFAGRPPAERVVRYTRIELQIGSEP